METAAYVSQFNAHVYAQRAIINALYGQALQLRVILHEGTDREEILDCEASPEGETFGPDAAAIGDVIQAMSPDEWSELTGPILD